MFGENQLSHVLLVAVLTFLVNIPFGYWRAKTKKLSKEWFLAVHLPVPLIVVFRLLFGVHLNIPTFIVFVVAFFLGQRTGIILNRLMEKKIGNTSKNVFSDLLRLLSKGNVEGQKPQKGNENKEVH
jgi:pilus assembly protein TadC